MGYQMFSNHPSAVTNFIFTRSSIVGTDCTADWIVPNVSCIVCWRKSLDGSMSEGDKLGYLVIIYHIDYGVWGSLCPDCIQRAKGGQFDGINRSSTPFNDFPFTKELKFYFISEDETFRTRLIVKVFSTCSKVFISNDCFCSIGNHKWNWMPQREISASESILRYLGCLARQARGPDYIVKALVCFWDYAIRLIYKVYMASCRDYRVGIPRQESRVWPVWTPG